MDFLRVAVELAPPVHGASVEAAESECNCVHSGSANALGLTLGCEWLADRGLSGSECAAITLLRCPSRSMTSFLRVALWADGIRELIPAPRRFDARPYRHARCLRTRRYRGRAPQTFIIGQRAHLLLCGRVVLNHEMLGNVLTIGCGVRSIAKLFSPLNIFVRQRSDV
jgi:hypothetical protein